MSIPLHAARLRPLSLLDQGAINAFSPYNLSWAAPLPKIFLVFVIKLGRFACCTRVQFTRITIRAQAWVAASNERMCDISSMIMRRPSRPPVNLPRFAGATPWTAILLLGLLVGFRCPLVHAQDTEETLAEKVNDPTADLMQLQFKDTYTPANYGTTAQPNAFLLRPILAVRPYLVTPLTQIIRPTFNVVTNPVGKGASTRTELGDTQVFDLFLSPWPDPKSSGLRWGIGPYWVFPTASDKAAGDGAWEVGPAAAFRYELTPRLMVSALLQQATSFAYVSSDRVPVTILTLQPMITYQFGKGWYVKSSDATWTFNLRHNTSTQISLSLGLGKVWKFSSLYSVNLSFAGQWMAYQQFSSKYPQFSLVFQGGLLFPGREL